MEHPNVEQREFMSIRRRSRAQIITEYYVKLRGWKSHHLFSGVPAGVSFRSSTHLSTIWHRNRQCSETRAVASPEKGYAYNMHARNKIMDGVLLGQSISLETLESLAVSCLVSGHLMNSIIVASRVGNLNSLQDQSCQQSRRSAIDSSAGSSSCCPLPLRRSSANFAAMLSLFVNGLLIVHSTSRVSSRCTTRAIARYIPTSEHSPSSLLSDQKEYLR